MMKESAEPQNSEMTSAGATRYIVFYLGDGAYAVPLLKVREVIAQTEITPVPYTPRYLKGVTNLRGQVISVIDLRVKLKIKAADPSSETAIIILDLAPVSLGVVVDAVDSVVAIHPQNIRLSPDLESEIANDLMGIARIDDKLILILDIDRILNLEDLTGRKAAA